ncbi:hypothetical protein SK128_013081 [Halocaridina rubra]|uniref:Uncharacterized protein n=1 Tax=Halocaridina rubra TaxID=373956 RepID=A0AAN9AFL3_HALRR
MTKLLLVVVFAFLMLTQALASPAYGYRGYRYRRPRYHSSYPNRVVNYGVGPGSLAVHGSPYGYSGYGFGATYVAQNPGAVHIVHGALG